jgi:flagellar basal body P-ring formation protein FlgA
MKITTPILVAALGMASPAWGQPFEDLDALEARVAAAAPTHPIDRRLKLARCPDPVVIDPPALGAIALRCPALGWRIRLNLAQASIAQLAQRQSAVRRNDVVDVVIRGSGFELSANGTALDDAAIGEPVRVKTPTSAAPLRGTVVGAGLVEISD